MTQSEVYDGQAMPMAGDLIARGDAVQQIRTSYVTAVSVQKPRDIALVEKGCMKEAALAGESIYYGWGAGKDRIEGPSIEAAMILARNWGNAALDMLPVQDTHDAWIFTASFIDCEAGVTVTRQFRQSKRYTVHGKMDAERKDDIRFQIGQSKALRNVVLAALPGWITDRMIEKAKQGVREKIEQYIQKNGIEGARDLVVKALAKHGIDEERLEAKIGKPIGAWQVEELTILKGDIKALNDRTESPETIFPPPKDKAGSGSSVAEKVAAKAARVDDDKRGQEEPPAASSDAEPKLEAPSAKASEEPPAPKAEEPEAEPDPESEDDGPPPEDSPEAYRQKLMTMKRDEIIAVAARKIGAADNAEIFDGDKFMSHCLRKGILADADLEAKKNTVRHLVMFIMAIDDAERKAAEEAA